MITVRSIPSATHGFTQRALPDIIQDYLGNVISKRCRYRCLVTSIGGRPGEKTRAVDFWIDAVSQQWYVIFAYYPGFWGLKYLCSPTVDIQTQPDRIHRPICRQQSLFWHRREFKIYSFHRRQHGTKLHTIRDDDALTRIPLEEKSSAIVWNNGRARNGGLLLQLLVTTWKGRKLWFWD